MVIGRYMVVAFKPICPAICELRRAPKVRPMPPPATKNETETDLFADEELSEVAVG
jgi:hypothetical protein